MRLEIVNITKQYRRGRVRALDSVSICFTPGIYGLLGPNGAGKSTLMNILTGGLRADTGQVRWNGTEIQKIPLPYRKTLGYAPQHQGIYEEFTANRFLWYLAALKGIPKKEAAVEIEQVLQVVGLTAQQNRRLGTFSGGMKQRVLIAQALLGDPQLLILDEPTAGLDPQERIHIRNFISRISTNRIVILATHVVQDVAGIAKEMILLGNGKVRMQGTPDEICSTLDGKVWEVRIPARQAAAISEQYLVSNLLEGRNGIVQARLISETEPVLPDATCPPVSVPAGIEDVYLSLFDHRREGRR